MGLQQRVRLRKWLDRIDPFLVAHAAKLSGKLSGVCTNVYNEVNLMMAQHLP